MTQEEFNQKFTKPKYLVRELGFGGQEVNELVGTEICTEDILDYINYLEDKIELMYEDLAGWDI